MLSSHCRAPGQESFQGELWEDLHPRDKDICSTKRTLVRGWHLVKHSNRAEGGAAGLLQQSAGGGSLHTWRLQGAGQDLSGAAWRESAWRKTAQGCNEEAKKVTVYSQELEDKVSRFCVYALTFYIPTFFKSSQGCDAPSNNLKLYKDLLAFRSIDETLTAVALATMDWNCWYLALSVVMFSLFSKQVSDDPKARMVAKLLTFEKPEKNRVGLQAFPTVTGESQL